MAVNGNANGTEHNGAGGGSLSDEPRAGFAKLVFADREIFLRKYGAIVGRHSKSNLVDVDLGQGMNISRQHAKIVYNFEKGRFELEVLGKNGVRVSGNIHAVGSIVKLQSQDLIEIGDQSFYFLLPIERPQSGSAVRKRGPKKRKLEEPETPAPAHPADHSDVDHEAPRKSTSAPRPGKSKPASTERVRHSSASKARPSYPSATQDAQPEVELEIVSVVRDVLAAREPPGQYVLVSDIGRKLIDRYPDLSHRAKCIALQLHHSEEQSTGGPEQQRRWPWGKLATLLRRHPEVFRVTSDIPGRPPGEYVDLLEGFNGHQQQQQQQEQRARSNSVR
eukprot:jgi/Chlat1/2592/Chrsp178S02451